MPSPAPEIVAVPMPHLDRAAELTLINAWIAEHGVTRCESRFAFRSNALSGYELAARLVAFTPRPRPPTQGEIKRRAAELLRLSMKPDVDACYRKWLLQIPIR
jgi:hypothetical protein